MLPTADVKLPSLFVCSSVNWGYKGMFSLANILQIAQWRIQGRGQTGGGGGISGSGRPSLPYLKVWWILHCSNCHTWVACILAISSSQNVRSFLSFSSALPKNWANATESRSTSLFSGDRMYRWRYLTGYLKRPNSVNASLLWRISGEIQANQKRRNILIE